jgi:hypothetical protein
MGGKSGFGWSSHHKPEVNSVERFLKGMPLVELFCQIS